MTVTPPDPDAMAVLVVSPETLAKKIRGIPTPLSAEHEETLRDAILDAQTDVEAYLGRPIVPTRYIESDRWAYFDGESFNLTMLGDEPLITIENVVAQVIEGQPTGYYTVTYLAGIDARTDSVLRPIRRFVELHAMHSPAIVQWWKVVTKAKGEVRSESAEGQSVSFSPASLSGNAVTGVKPGDFTPGSLPTMASLDRWRVAGRRVHQGPTLASNWPYVGGRW